MADTEALRQFRRFVDAIPGDRLFLSDNSGVLPVLGGLPGSVPLTAHELRAVLAELDRLAAVEAAAPDQARDHTGRVMTVPVTTLARKIAEKRDALAKLDEACREVDRLRGILAEILQTFVHKTHPGHPCLQSGHIDVATVERWRSALYTPGGM